ncbi:MAG TPA: tetratricopeptide repeat protein [Rhodothermales bacterium]|nr:tetratricopeptide repeat protein [Rhodothermales bacterium]
MEAARWERMQALFHEALRLTSSSRKSFLEQSCEDDSELAADVLALLQADEASGSLLDQDPARVAHEMLDGPIMALRKIGPYRIQEVLGRGGMGVVFLAERDDIGGRAAIKVLRDAALSPARRERFVREEQMLARLSHPSIARLYDADVLHDGTPYFVMEYVEGTSLLSYCAAHDYSIRERMGLFRAVCEAVQYAHRHAVVHRDLKPSNILVRQDGQVKLLDFGIAKQIESFDTPVHQTQTGLRMMTPAYAAPEQLRGDTVGLYTDVYALGVVLYELLSGQLPFESDGLTPGQAEARILEQEPVKPSARARRAAGGARRPLPGRSIAWAELDVLCLKAMHKEVERRYPTVEALIRDVDHCLKGEPLEARPDSLGYRAGKFLRRNWRPVSALALMVAMILGITVFYTVRLARARDAALEEAARTQRIQQFTLNLFEGGDASVGPADSLRVVTLLGRGVSEARLLDEDPAIQAEMYQTLGGIYQKLGNFQDADSLLTDALALRRLRFGPDNPEVAGSLVALGLLRIEQAEFEEAEGLIRRGLDMNRRYLPAVHPAVVKAANALGRVLQEQGAYEQAIALLEETVRLQTARKATGGDLSASLIELANIHYYAGHYAASDSLNRLALVMNRKLYGARHPLVADVLINLGAVQFEWGHYGEAERFYRQALEINLAFYGPDHPEIASDLTMLSRAFIFQERDEEALGMLRRALQIRERVYGTEHPSVASTLNELGTIAMKQGDLPAAVAYYNRMAAIYRAAYGDEHYLVGIALSNLATVYMRSGSYGRAEPLFRGVIDRFTETLSPDHLYTGIARIKLGHVLVKQERYEDAASQLLAGYEILARDTDPSVSWLQSARKDLVTVYEVLGDSEKAQAFRAQLAEQEGP